MFLRMFEFNLLFKCVSEVCLDLGGVFGLSDFDLTMGTTKPNLTHKKPRIPECEKRRENCELLQT